jgi:hypothetical protein
MEDPRSLSNFDSMCKSPNVEYFLLESKMRSVTNMNISMVNLASHTNLLSKNSNNVGISIFKAFSQGGGGGTRLGKSKHRVHGGNGGLRILHML